MPPARIVSKPSKLLVYLFEAWPDTKKKQVRAWLKFGSVAVNDRIVTQFDHSLKPGDSVLIRPKGMAAPETKLAGGIRIRHEDADIIVIEKPAGLLSIASPSEEEKTAYAFLTSHVRLGNPRGRERVWVVHRLDRETSGLMIFAKNEPAKVALQEGWEAVEKKYFAVVEGAPRDDAGTFESWLDESNPLKVYAGASGPEARHATTHYRITKKAAVTRPGRLGRVGSTAAARGGVAGAAFGRLCCDEPCFDCAVFDEGGFDNLGQPTRTSACACSNAGSWGLGAGGAAYWGISSTMFCPT
jgi:23S rRNA pseudouridine1911/1915/1917 synthase